MSHDHLQCDRLKLRRRGKNLNLVAKNLDVNHRMKGDLMTIHRVNHRKMVGPKTDDRMRLNRASHLMMVCLKKI